MGAILGVGTSTGADIPFWFTRTDSKEFLYHLLAENHIDKIATYFDLDVTGLHAVVEREAEPLDAFVARDLTKERYNVWMQMQEQRKATWQTPKSLMRLFVRLAEALHTNPAVYAHLHLTDAYFTQGYVHQDIEDLYHMMAWAEQQQIEHVRLEVAGLSL